jgi:Flp pilus assembly pilin Flp
MKLLDRAALAAKMKVDEILKAVTVKRDGGIGVVVTVILLLIAIIMLTTFRSEITGWITSINSEVSAGLTSNFKPN